MQLKERKNLGRQRCMLILRPLSLWQGTTSLLPDIWKAPPKCDIYRSPDNEKVEAPSLCRLRTSAREGGGSGQFPLLASLLPCSFSVKRSHLCHHVYACSWSWALNFFSKVNGFIHSFFFFSLEKTILRAYDGCNSLAAGN